MDIFRIVKINYNVEVISKIINSIDKKYDWRVKFNRDTGTVVSGCETANKPRILGAVMGILGVNWD